VIRLLLVGGKNKFASVEHIGPKWMADFLEVTEREDRDIIMRRAYEKINELLDLLHISAWKESKLLEKGFFYPPISLSGEVERRK
jgi:hypothetical protein